MQQKLECKRNEKINKKDNKNNVTKTAVATMGKVRTVRPKEGRQIHTNSNHNSWNNR